MTADTLWLPPAEPRLTRLDGETWMTRRPDGDVEPIRLDDMSADHRWHVLQWLRRHAELMQAHEMSWIAHLFRYGAISLDRFAERARVLDATPADVWIEDTPLVRRLHDLIRRDRAGRRWGR